MPPPAATSTDLARLANAELVRRELEARRAAAQIELARRLLSAFAQQAIAAGVIDGIARVDWGPHLEAVCWHTQLQLEGWLVANGPDRDSAAWQAWACDRAEMIARQREHWERWGAVWEDGEPEPWLRYVLVQNQLKNLPPGTLKSTLVMVIANAWIWLLEPRFAFRAFSGVEANVGRDSRATRDLVRSPWYRERFAIAWSTADSDAAALGLAMPDDASIDIRRDADAVEAWTTTAGGKRVSSTITSGVTGGHFDGLFIDDPDDADKVWSEPERLKPQNRYTRAIENRVNNENRSIRLVMQQRTYPLDFTAYLLSILRWSPTTPKGWAWLCIPAEFGRGPDDVPAETPYGWRDWRTDPGQTIHRLLSPGVLAHKRLTLATYEWQYNLNPKHVTDGIFKRRHARFFLFDGERSLGLRGRPLGCLTRDELPPIVVRRDELRQVTLSVDAANSLDPKPGAKVSAVGLIVGACRGDDRFMLDDRTRVLGVAGTYLAIYELLAAWAIDRVLVELKALGAGVISELTTAIRRGWYVHPTEDRHVDLLGPDGKRVRCEVEPYQPGKESKPQRAHAGVPAWQEGHVFLHDGAEWLYAQTDASRKTIDDGFMDEICGFGAGAAKSDRVDAVSQFLARYRGATDARADLQAMRRLALVGRR